MGDYFGQGPGRLDQSAAEPVPARCPAVVAVQRQSHPCHLARHVAARNESEVARVRAVVTVVSHHEHVAFRDDVGAVLARMVAAEDILGEPFVERNIVDVKDAALEFDRLTFYRYTSLDVVRLLVARVFENNDVGWANWSW